MDIKQRCNKFVENVNAMKKADCPIGLSDLVELAKEFATPIPTFDKDLNLIWNKEDFNERK